MRKILEEDKVTFYQLVLENGTIVVTREDKEPLPKKWTLAEHERKFKEEIKNGKKKTK